MKLCFFWLNEYKHLVEMISVLLIKSWCLFRRMSWIWVRIVPFAFSIQNIICALIEALHVWPCVCSGYQSYPFRWLRQWSSILSLACILLFRIEIPKTPEFSNSKMDKKRREFTIYKLFVCRGRTEDTKKFHERVIPFVFLKEFISIVTPTEAKGREKQGQAQNHFLAK